MFTSHHLAHITCPVACVFCHVSHVTGHIFFLLKKKYKVGKLVGGGSVINGAPRLVSFQFTNPRIIFFGFKFFTLIKMLHKTYRLLSHLTPCNLEKYIYVSTSHDSRLTLSTSPHTTSPYHNFSQNFCSRMG